MKITTHEHEGKIYYLAHTQYITISGPTGSVCTEHETLEEAQAFVDKVKVAKQKWIDKQLGRDL